MTRTKRAVVAAGVAWIPLLLLSVFVDEAAGRDIRVPFLGDIGAHVRLLIALPLYLLIARYIDPPFRSMIAEFLRRRLVRDEDRYRSLVRRMRTLVTSRRTLTVIIAVGFTRSVISVALESGGSWAKYGDGFRFSAAGWWYALVSLPLLFTISGRWIWKVLVWTYFLAAIARIPLRLVPTQPDGAGGLGFIGLAHSRLAFLVCIANTGLAAKIAVAVIFVGHAPGQYKWAILTVVAIEVALLLGPLIPFMPILMRLRREGSLTYGRLGMGYVRLFEERWTPPVPETPKSMLGTADIQSLADLANSYAIVEETRVLLVTRRDLIKMIGLAVLPFLPLALTVMSLIQLLQLGKSLIL